MAEDKKEQHPNQISLEGCVFRKIDNKAKVCKERSIGTDMIISFDYMESILSPFVSGALLLSDSKDFINTFPIEGGEEVELAIKHSFNKNAQRYIFRVYKIASRIIDGKKQVYNLLLVSEEALINESVRVQTQQDGEPSSIIIKMIREELKSSKEVFSEPSRFKVRMIPNNKRPFDLVAQLIKRSVSSKTTYGQSQDATENTTESEQQIKGSAGFFFWENNRGYNLFSVDALCDTSEEGTFIVKKDKEPNLKSQSWGPYVEIIANTDASGDARFNITAFTLNAEVDILSSLRLGKYSTKMVFFNHSTGQYDEYVYKIKDSYDNMAHLGGQSTVSLVPGNTDELSGKPTRVMSAVLDSETWYDDPEVKDPEDPKVKNPTEYADWVKYYAAQSVARYDLLQNQEGTLKIPPNPLICSGDKITLRLNSKLPDSLKDETPYDKESSGVYLVKEVTHTFNFVNGGTSGNGYSTLRLFRDSYGTDVDPSAHGE